MHTSNNQKPNNRQAGLDYYSRFMGALFPDQKRLSEIQAVYDNLTLLGQLLGAGTDITKMRADFQNLATVLLDQLAQEHYKKAALGLQSNARIAVEVLTRNLFERTADIGFLATDPLIRGHAATLANSQGTEPDSAKLREIRHHFAEYISKYSVYHNIVLLSPSGKVLAQFDETNPVSQVSDPFIEQALSARTPYVEVFRPTPLLPNEGNALVYASRVTSPDGYQTLGVLCLCFRFEDECQRIFSNLVEEDDWRVVTLLDEQHKVIASSDPYQFPLGSRLKPVDGSECAVIRFGGREYLAANTHASSYQGYAVPGWRGCALAPLNHAFDVAQAEELRAVPEGYLMDILDACTLFSEDLRDIPVQAALIQQELNRAVWNGNIGLARQEGTANPEFAKVLLREIGRTGVKTREVFNESTTNLYKTVLASLMLDCATRAALAIDIMDRNLYERANDCRWWALTETFSQALDCQLNEDDGLQANAQQVLQHINSLYTVYTNIILFDRNSVVVSASNPDDNCQPGAVLDYPWVRHTLGLKDTQSYHTSDFVCSSVYGGQATYVFTAAVRDKRACNSPLGGVAVVFDSSPQFHSMLRDVLPRNSNGELLGGAFAVFVDRDGRVVSSTHNDFSPGSVIPLDPDLLAIEQGSSTSRLVEFAGRYHALGVSASTGYREYQGIKAAKGQGLVSLVFMPLSEAISISTGRLRQLGQQIAKRESAVLRGVPTIDIATFSIHGRAFGLAPDMIVSVVDAEKLSAVHSIQEALHGYLMFEGGPIPVFELASLLDSQPGLHVPETQARLGIKKQVLVLSVSKDAEPFGILIDDLGEIAEVELERVSKLPALQGESASVIEGIVKPSWDDSTQQILLLLSASRLYQNLLPQPVLAGQF